MTLSCVVPETRFKSRAAVFQSADHGQPRRLDCNKPEERTACEPYIFIDDMAASKTGRRLLGAGRERSFRFRSFR